MMWNLQFIAIVFHFQSIFEGFSNNRLIIFESYKQSIYLKGSIKTSKLLIL